MTAVRTDRRAAPRLAAIALVAGVSAAVLVADPFGGDGARTDAASPATVTTTTAGPAGWAGDDATAPAVATTAAPTTAAPTTAPVPDPPKAAGRTPAPVPGHVVAAWVGGPGIDLHATPGGEVLTTLANPRSTGAPLVLQVVVDRGEWLAVRAPTRPNGLVAWVRATGLSFTTSDVRIVVDVGDRTVTAYRGDEVLGTVPGAVGRAATPTPLGTFYVTEAHDLRGQQSVYGTFALGLSAFSETLSTFNGGDAQTAIHGTWATESVGQVVSNGCVRLYNADVEWLASVAPVGTPVEIVA
jgi:lipoprotein-anchoring transpeptidase ErfK/SrfK